MTALGLRVPTAVSVYPGDRPKFTASPAEALTFAQQRIADGFGEPLMLGAMRPGYLGREAVTVADLLAVLCSCGKSRDHDGACLVPLGALVASNPGRWA